MILKHISHYVYVLRRVLFKNCLFHSEEVLTFFLSLYELPKSSLDRTAKVRIIRFPCPGDGAAERRGGQLRGSHSRHPFRLLRATFVHDLHGTHPSGSGFYFQGDESQPSGSGSQQVHLSVSPRTSEASYL